MRQEHFSRPEEIADDVHARHQWPLDHVERPGGLLPRLLHVLIDVVGQSLHQRMGQPFLHRSCPPLVVLHRRLALLFDRVGKGHQPLRGIRPAVQQHVFDQRQQIFGDLLVDGQLPRIDDPHVETGLYGMVEERSMHRLAHDVVAAKRERNIADAAADLGQRQVLLDPPCRIDKIDRVVVVLFESGRDRENIRIENNILRRHPDLFRQQTIGPLTDLDPPCNRVSLPPFIERHDHDRRAVPTDEPRLFEELRLAFLQTDGIDDALPLYVAKALFDDLPLGTVHHDRHPSDVRFRRQQPQKLLHCRFGVQHAFVHINVDDLRPAFHLLTRDGQRLVIIAGQNQLGKGR